ERVDCAINRPHRAAAQLTDDLVAAEGLFYHVFSGGSPQESYPVGRWESSLRLRCAQTSGSVNLGLCFARSSDHHKEVYVKKLLAGCISLLLLGGAWAQDNASANKAGGGVVQLFVTLPDGVRFPEGITANPANGDIYVSTFDGGGQNKLLRYSRHGRLL